MTDDKTLPEDEAGDETLSTTPQDVESEATTSTGAQVAGSDAGDENADEGRNGDSVEKLENHEIIDDDAEELTNADETIDDLDTFTAQALERIGLANPYVAPRYRPSYFAHIFGSGYDAAYYSYIWSEMMDADTVEWFDRRLEREVGDTFRRELLSRGDSRDPMDSFRAFRGRDAEIEPLLKRRGLAG